MHNPLKRVVYLPDLIPNPDSDRIRFPGGVICEVIPNGRTETAKRVENVVSNERAGLLREMFVAYSANQTLLDVARRSDQVVEVRSVDWKKKHDAENYKQDMLLLKRFSGDEEHIGNRLLAPLKWMEKIGIDVGDRIIVSNPISNFTIPLELRTQN